MHYSLAHYLEVLERRPRRDAGLAPEPPLQGRARDAHRGHRMKILLLVSRSRTRSPKADRRRSGWITTGPRTAQFERSSRRGTVPRGTRRR
ncbi:MAG: hypothetical protein U0802_12745 [Candidatus Binatia bacterium]